MQAEVCSTAGHEMRGECCKDEELLIVVMIDVITNTAVLFVFLCNFHCRFQY